MANSISTSSSSRSRSSSTSEKQPKSKSAIGLMAGILFNRGTTSTSNNSNSNSNMNYEHPKPSSSSSSTRGRGVSNRRRGGGASINNGAGSSPEHANVHAHSHARRRHQQSSNNISSSRSNRRYSNNNNNSIASGYGSASRYNNNNSNSSNININNQYSTSAKPSMSLPSSTTSQRSPTHDPNQSEGGGLLSPPVGLSGPTQFEFSPPVNVNSRYSLSQSESHSQSRCMKRPMQRYLSFLSSHSPPIPSPTSASFQNHNHANAPSNINGSPVRSMGGGGIPGHNEKRLCALDLKPFYKTIRLMERKTKQQYEYSQPQHQQQKNTMTIDSNKYASAPDKWSSIEPITDPNLLMDEHVTHLLNTSLPLDRPDERMQQQMAKYMNLHSNSPTSPSSSSAASPNNRNQFGGLGGFGGSPLSTTTSSSNVDSDSGGLGTISLEERLRRERQRLHSNGVTQFSWSIYNPNLAKSPLASSMKTASLMNDNKSSPRRPPSPEKYMHNDITRILVPLHGNIYIQDGVGPTASSPLRLLYDKSMLEEKIINTQHNNDNVNRKDKYNGTTRANSNGSSKARKKKGEKNRHTSIKSVVGRDASAIDPQLSPDGSMVAFVVAGEIYVMSCTDTILSANDGSDGHANDDVDVVDDDNDDDGRNDCNSSREFSTAYHDNEENAELDEQQQHMIMMRNKPVRVTFGAMIDDSTVNEDDLSDGDSSSDESDDGSKVKKRYGRSVTHGLADFVAQEEIDRYRGFWWDRESRGILFVRVDESCVPPYRITHQGRDGIAGDESNYEDHRYPFAGESNPDVDLGYVRIDREFLLKQRNNGSFEISDDKKVDEGAAELNWSQVKWFDPPAEVSEYLARVNWLPNRSVCVQWQDRRQSKLVLVKIDIETGESIILHKEQSDIWINLHHMFKLLPEPIHPNECLNIGKNDLNNHDLPKGSFSFLFASERTGYCHVYLYTFIPGDTTATLLRAVSAGEWIVESIVGIDLENDMVYVTGTYDSPLERHLYALPLKSTASEKRTDNGVGVGVRRGLKQVMSTFSGTAPATKRRDIYCFDHAPPVCIDPPPDPIRLTNEKGMHSVVMDESCRIFVDTSSDLNRPPSSKVYYVSDGKVGATSLLFVLYDATLDIKDDIASVSAPELLSFPTSDGTETLHAALYCPDASIHGSGPYPLICAVYGGPHVQRVNRSWCQCADMRAQRLCSLGFAVIKCDNRGSARRGLAFEGAIKNNLGRIEVLDQVAAVRFLTVRRIADPSRVGVYGWSYGGYLSAMCLCRAPDVFHVAIAGAPVTSWDGYDTHYTERYMGMPNENASGYHESAVFQHVQNMRGRLMIIHGLIDENVHFRHTARLINHLISGGKDYDLLIFPDERHSPRRLRDRVYMEKRMSDYFIKNLLDRSKDQREVMLMGHL